MTFNLKETQTQYNNDITLKETQTNTIQQGSVLGAKLFLLYCGDLQLIIESHGLCLHLYAADDSQIYGFCRPAAYTELQSRISTCIDHVAEWMRSIRIQLNAAKTEILWSAISRQLHQLPQAPLRVGTDFFVTPSAAVRDLGIHLDSDMSMSSTSGRQCQLVSLCWGSFVPFAVQCPDPWFSHYWRHLSSVAWTTETRHWLVFLNIFFGGSSQWWMQLLD